MPESALNKTASETSLRYVALGDSLTIGHGARPTESWPSRLVQALQSKGLALTLVRNLAHSGYTSRQVLQEQVPELPALKPDFVSLLIGSNDMARGIEPAAFAKNFTAILDQTQQALSDPNQLLLLNLPDFAATPAALKYQGHAHLAPYMQQFNQIIESEARTRNLAVVDLHQITRELGPDTSLYSWDGLHPSAKGYEVLEKFIRPVAVNLLRRGNTFTESAS